MKLHRATILIGLLAAALLAPACTTPPWALEAEKIAQVALPIVEGITVIVGAGPAVAQAETDINLLITLFEKYQATPESGTLAEIQSGLATVNADIAQIMPATGVKDAATQNKITAILQLVTSEFSNIASLIPASAAPVAGGANGLQPTAHSAVTPNPALPGKSGGIEALANSLAGPHPALPLSSKDFKKKYNDIVKGDSRFKKM